MEQFIQAVSVPVIAAIVYVVINIIKGIVNGNEKFMRLIPLISCVLGAVLGVIAFYGVPELTIASNVFAAIVIGGASGLTATGTNQVIKQLGKGGEKNDEEQSQN